MKKVEICTTLELSKFFGITRSEVLKCVAEGMPIIKRNQYHFLACFSWYPNKKNTRQIYNTRIRKLNSELIDKKMLQIERSRGEINPNKDSKGRWRPPRENWKKLIPKMLKSFREGMIEEKLKQHK